MLLLGYDICKIINLNLLLAMTKDKAMLAYLSLLINRQKKMRALKQSCSMNLKS